MFAEGLDTTMVGLDVTHRALDHRRAHRAAARGGPRRDGGRGADGLLRALPQGSAIRISTARRCTIPVCIAHLIDPALRRRPRRVHRGRLHAPGRAGAGRTSTGAAASTSARRTPRSRSTSTASASPSCVVERISVARVIARLRGDRAARRPGVRRSRTGRRGRGWRSSAAASPPQRPEAVIVVTPHGVARRRPLRRRALAGGCRGRRAAWTDADTRYEGPGEPELADACVQSLQAADLPGARDHVRGDRGGTRRRCRSTGAR